MVNGAVPVVEALCDHPGINAVTFVGSSRVAEIVAQRCRAINKRVLALGGAKNHLVALPDCDQEMVVNDILTSAFGSAGQRCMAASALVLVGDTGPLLDSIVEAASKLLPGSGVGEVGPIIDAAGYARTRRLHSPTCCHRLVSSRNAQPHLRICAGWSGLSATSQRRRPRGRRCCSTGAAGTAPSLGTTSGRRSCCTPPPRTRRCRTRSSVRTTLQTALRNAVNS